MNKKIFSINDVLEALAIRINDILRPDKKSKNKKNNAYFWAFKLLLLILLIISISWMFKCFDKIGVAVIYFVANSLRSVLASIWSFSLAFIKGLMILYLLYDNFKIFIKSDYYKNLYANNRAMKSRKEFVFAGIELILKVFSVFFMIVVALFGVFAIYAFIIVIIMLIKNIYIISPLIITGSLFFLALITLLHIKNKFFDNIQTITNNHFIFAFSILVIGIFTLGYEMSSYEYINSLPVEMDLITKEASFDLNDDIKINLNNDSKLKNLVIEYDESLNDKMYISFEYFETANVKYTYTFNENDDLDLFFSSKLKFKPRNINDVFKLIHSTFNRKTMYNYNLFKYPNITVRVSPKYKKNITIE